MRNSYKIRSNSVSPDKVSQEIERCRDNPTFHLFDTYGIYHPKKEPVELRPLEDSRKYEKLAPKQKVLTKMICLSPNVFVDYLLTKKGFGVLTFSNYKFESTPIEQCISIELESYAIHILALVKRELGQQTKPFNTPIHLIRNPIDVTFPSLSLAYATALQILSKIEQTPRLKRELGVRKLTEGKELIAEIIKIMPVFGKNTLASNPSTKISKKGSSTPSKNLTTTEQLHGTLLSALVLLSTIMDNKDFKLTLGIDLKSHMDNMSMNKALELLLKYSRPNSNPKKPETNQKIVQGLRLNSSSSRKDSSLSQEKSTTTSSTTTATTTNNL